MRTNPQQGTDQTVWRHQAIGFLLLVGLVILATLLVRWRTFSAGKNLALNGENGIGVDLLLFGCAALFGLALCIFGAVITLVRLVKHRRFSTPYFAGSALIATALLYRGDFYMDGVRSRLMPINETSYLLFAQQTRAFLKENKVESMDFQALEFPSETVEKAQVMAFSKILKGSALAVWPERFSSVSVDGESVWLTRGTGMLGTMGVRIFDQQSEALLPPAAEPRGRAYGSIECRISPRVLFTIRD